MKYMHSRISYFDRMEKQIRDDVLSLNNYKFGDFVDRIFPIELEIKEITDTATFCRSASYLDLHLEIDSEGQLRTKHYDKRDDFNFPKMKL